MSSTELNAAPDYDDIVRCYIPISSSGTLQDEGVYDDVGMLIPFRACCIDSEARSAPENHPIHES